MKHFFGTFTHYIPSLRKLALLALSLGLALFFMVLSFGSCSNTPTNTLDQGSTVANNNADDDEETSRRRSSSADEPEGCDDDEGDPCRDDEDCEAACALIYKGKTTSITSCKNRGDETVGKLEEIHDILMGQGAGTDNAEERSASEVESDLAKIADDDDVDHDDLKCYLQIGHYKYIKEIENGLRKPSDTAEEKRDNLIATLKWLVKDDMESAEIIADLNAGDNILEELLLRLAEFENSSNNKESHCLSENTIIESPVNSLSENKDIWDLDRNNIKVYQAESGPSVTNTSDITLDNTTDATLYDALSCNYTDVDSNRNIFSYSADKDNKHIFDLAFGLLRNICEDVKNNGHDEDKGCARVMMCWTAWREANSGSVVSGTANADGSKAPSTSEDNDLWKMAKDHKSQLEPEDGGSDYNECEVRHFADFF